MDYFGFSLSCRSHRIISILSENLQSRTLHLNLNIPVCGTRFGRGISQRVLVTSLGCDLGVSFFDRITREFGEQLPSAGCRNVLGKNVAVAHARQVQPLDLAIDGQGSAV